MSGVEVEGLNKRYGTVAALADVSIRFADGEFFGLLGPSGSGKTTLLRSIAGFVLPDSGSIAIGGRRVERVPVHKRDIGMVFQNYALFPHMTVAENIAFGLDVRRVGGADSRRRVAEMLELVRLGGYQDRKPRQLSGGQQQRVALARALVTRPTVLLLDEPLGALDRRLRQEMQVELKQIQREVGITTIFVTHDQEEALTLSDRIAIIQTGRVAQIGPPQQVYERPATAFAAQFLGDANLFPGRIRAGALALDGGPVLHAPGLAGREGDAATVIVRPEKLSLLRREAAVPADLENRLEGSVLQSIYSGSSTTYRVAVPAAGATPVVAFLQNRSAAILDAGTPVTVAWSAADTVPIAP